MRGQRIALSLPRRFVNDLLWAARGVPTVPVQKSMTLGRLQEARAALVNRPSWCSLFMLAFARVARDIPELRRAFVKYPKPHLYQYPVSVANIAIEREYDGENGVFVARIKDPALLSIKQAHTAIHDLQTQPISACKDFVRSLRISALPTPVRRFFWWVAINAPRQRGNYVGTFGVSVYSALGAESLHPISPCSLTLTYGSIQPDGQVDARIIYDHRVTDGATIARALNQIEAEMNERMAVELEQLAGSQVAPPPTLLRVAV